MKNPFKSNKIKDPVCGMDVNPDRTELQANWNGKEFHFCSADCKRLFESSPERFSPKQAPVAGCCRTAKAGGCHDGAT